jgi:DMSO/TMAO reductase YedYZ molybdopterin-dependent catalytic subunit
MQARERQFQLGLDTGRARGPESCRVGSEVLQQLGLADPCVATHDRCAALSCPDVAEQPIEHVAVATAVQQHIAPRDAPSLLRKVSEMAHHPMSADQGPAQGYSLMRSVRETRRLIHETPEPSPTAKGTDDRDHDVDAPRLDRRACAMTVSRGFRGRRRVDADPARVPPGQYVTSDFPVLSAGPTPHTPLAAWTLTIRGEVDAPASWTWDELRALPSETFTVDIHCVTKWSKLGTSWTGVSLDTLLDGVETSAEYVYAFCDGGYTTNLPLEDATGGKAWIAYEYEGEPLEPEHGGPARLLVPHLYFWKSAKWVRGIELRNYDEPGFWERYGYHNYGDPWKEQRYAGD